MHNEEQNKLTDTMMRMKLRNKSLAVISKKGNFEKLENLIQKTNERFAELSFQWNQIKSPLQEEYEMLQSKITVEDARLQEEQNKLFALQETSNRLSKDLKEKNVLGEALVEKCQQVPKSDKR